MATSGPKDAVHWMLPVGRSWQSITAGYVGLLSLGIWALGPVAIWLGIWAIRKARTGGHGRGRAVFAIVTGTLGTLFMALFLVMNARARALEASLAADAVSVAVELLGVPR